MVPGPTTATAAAETQELFQSIKSRKTFSYDYATGDVLKQGMDTLYRMGFNLKGYAQTETGGAYMIMCDNWGEDWLDLNGSEEYQAEAK
mgnify:CR=1 FL=1